jgi:ACS family glucarate transporter-like MFS transporter
MTPKPIEDPSPARMTTHNGHPTRARHLVIVFAITLSIITYIDRVCISQAAPNISRDLGLSREQMGLVFAAFGLSYAIFEIPGGWLGDWIGPRKVLMRVVVMWSIFTAATGWAWNLVSLWIARFIFGAGEAGCFPNLTKAFTIWLPQHERVRAQGIMWMSARWGGAFTPLLVVWIFSFMSWRNAFVLFGSLGIIWACFFYYWFRDNPRDHKGVNAAELALLDGAADNATGHSHIPWEKFGLSRTVWLLWLQYFCMSYPWYFYITWLPTYLQEGRGLAVEKSAVLAGFPLFFGGLGSLFCGLISARVAKWLGSTAKTRRFMAILGLTGASACFLIFLKVKDPTWAMFAMGMASFGNDLAMPGAWGACMDVGGKFAGSLSGSMNMMGNLAGFAAPQAVVMILGLTNNNWDVPIFTFSIVYLVGAVSWIFIDPVTPLDPRMTLGQQMPSKRVLLALEGRICRSTFWVRGLLPIGAFVFVTALVIAQLASAMRPTDTQAPAQSLFIQLVYGFSVLGLWPLLSILAKRCHDRGRSAWWLLIALIPIIGQIWLLVDIILPKGIDGDNRFGPDPLQEVA